MKTSLLTSSQAMLAILRQVPGNYLILVPDNPHFTIAEVSEQYNKTTLTQRDDIIGRRLFDVFPDNPMNSGARGAANLLASLNTVMETGEAHQMDVLRYDVQDYKSARFVAKFWQTINRPVFVDQQLAYIIHIIEDITENSLLKISESYFKALTDETPFMVWRCVNNHCNYVNKAWIDFTGLSFEESLGQGFTRSFHPDDVNEQLHLYEQAMQTGSVYESKYRLKNKDGEYRWVLTKAAPHKLEGLYVEYIGSLIDINDQEMARQRIEESEKQFKQLADSIIQMVWITDAQGMHEYYNQRWYDFTGTTFEHTKDEGWNNVFHPDDQPLAWKKWKHSLDSGEPYEIEYRLRKYTGEYVWVLGRAAPFYDAEGNIIKWFGTCTDIHEQKLLQQQREEFISVASHELKTPLTSLSASLQFLERQMQKEPVANPVTAKMILAGTTHVKKLTKLVNDLLDVTKIEQGQLVLNKNWFNISELVHAFVEHLNRNDYRISIYADPDITVCADAMKIEQVIANLVNNAIKYAPDSTQITIRIGQLTDVVHVSIQDYGPGIAADKARYLFDRYYRADPNGYQYSGLGLGLYICKQIINRHGGQIGVDTQEGQGSTFWFTIPHNSL